MTTPPARSLGRVLEDFGSTHLDLLHGDVEGAVEIGGVGIHDPHDEQRHPPHAIVLGVGVHGADEIVELLRRLGEDHAAALVVRETIEPAAELARVAAETGVVVLGLTRGVSWARGVVHVSGHRSVGSVPAVGVRCRRRTSVDSSKSSAPPALGPGHESAAQVVTALPTRLRAAWLA